MRLAARMRASEPAIVRCAALAALLCAAMFLLQGRLGINLQDEAFLWYGAVATHAGELPLRDFRAYDPGRYFWCAPFLALFGDGLVAVRGASWAFAGVGLTAGLLVVSRTCRSFAWLAIAGVVLVAWMSPPWKLYESSTAMLVAWIAVRLVESPTRGRRFAAGVAVGLAAFFGRNLGVYAGIAVLTIALVACWKSRAPLVRSLADVVAGTLAGYAPMLALVVFVDGYREALVDSIAFYARQGALNAELPFPFPWRLDLGGRTFLGAAASVVVGALFLVLPLAYLLAIARGVGAGREAFARWAPVFALACVGASWFHHASVRSDLPHLAQSIHPFLLMLFVLPSLAPPRHVRSSRIVVALVLVATTTFGIGTSLPVVRRVMARGDAVYSPVVVRGDELLLAPNERGQVHGVLAAVETRVPPDEELWVSAQFLGLYPILGRRAPAWDIYPAWPADDREQDRMLAELAAVRWALIDVRPIGGDPRMRLEASHPRVWRWLLAEFERVPLPGAPESTVLLRRKG